MSRAAAALDHHHRALSGADRELQERLRPALAAWTDYLTRVPAVSSFDRAAERGAPIVLRHRGSPGPGNVPLAVSPEWATRWARANGHHGAAGTGSALTLGVMVSALDFMHATAAVTFRPLVDDRDRRRRDGFFHLTGELHARLRSGNHTPTLTRRAGRPVAGGATVGPLLPRSGRALGTAEPDPTLTIVRDWIRTSEVTSLLAVAREQCRPLAVRAPGRPSTSARYGVPVQRGVVLGHVEMLAAHAIEHAGRGGWRVPRVASLTASLAAHATATPEVVAAVTRLSTPDAPGQRHLRGWWRFTLSAFGAPLLVAFDLAPEVEHWMASRERAAAAPVTPSVALPADVDPAWLDDPQYRDSIGMTDEEYARWREGQ